MVNSNPSLATLGSTIKHAIDSYIKGIHTSMPGIVESFNPTTQLATVQPAIKRVFITREENKEILTPVELPILINVPVIFPRGGGFSLTFPVEKGDECLLVFTERSIDSWHEFGEVREPSARRFHSLSDATAFVGLSSLPNKIPDYDPINLQLKKDDGTVSITLLGDGTINVTANTKVTVDAPDSEFTGNVKVIGNLEVIGSSVLSSAVTSGGKDISDTHAHPQAADSAGNSQQNTGAPL